MISFLGDSTIKPRIRAQLQAHFDADEIIQGKYWENGKGCAVGCTIHSNQHSDYETLFGIPEWLAHLEDTIFENLPNAEAKNWPLQFWDALPEGVDLDPIKHKFCVFILKENIERVLGLSISKDLKNQVVESIRNILKLHENQLALARSAEAPAEAPAALARLAAEEEAARAAEVRSTEAARAAAAAAGRSAEAAALARSTEAPAALVRLAAEEAARAAAAATARAAEVAALARSAEAAALAAARSAPAEAALVRLAPAEAARAAAAAAGRSAEAAALARSTEAPAAARSEAEEAAAYFRYRDELLRLLKETEKVN